MPDAASGGRAATALVDDARATLPQAGWVGVANAVKSHIDRRRDVIAAFKALGATGRDVFTIYLTQVVVLATIGSVIGLAAGAALPFIVVGAFGKLLPLPVIPALH